MLRKRTSTIRPADIDRKWYVIDASEAPLGRISTQVARLLSGKDKVNYTPHMDNGDFVVVINSDKLKVTGKKLEDKMYYKYTGYVGNLKSATLGEMMEKDSTKVIEKAIYGMIPKNKLRDERMKRLKVYKDENHAHAAQKPLKLEVK